MAFVKEKKPYVIYLTRTSMVWGGDGLKEMVTVEFASDVFVDLEFPNIRSLNNQVLTAIELHALKPNRVIFVLNQDLFYTQQFASASEEDIKNYLTMVPFTESISKRFINPTGLQLAVVGQDLVNPLVEVFTHHGFDVLFVLPDFAFGEKLKTLEQFTNETLDSLMITVEGLEPFSFYSPPKAQESMRSIRDAEGHIFNPRLIGMIVFFIVLIVIFVAVLFMNGYIGAPKKAVVTPAPVQPVEQVVPVPSVVPENTPEASASSSLSPNIQRDVVIEVLNDAQTLNSANQVKTQLTELGFTQVKSGTTTSVGQRTLILYRPTVSSETLQAITDVLTAQGLESSAQENPELSGSDVRIIPSSS